jgi:sec-independent protein translocase protein TatB
MFDFSWSELLLIGIVALVFIGPKELPGVLRTLGQWMAKVRRMATEFQNQFQDAMREAELADLKKEVDSMAAQASAYDPTAELRKDMANAEREIETALAVPSSDPPPPQPPTVESAAPPAVSSEPHPPVTQAAPEIAADPPGAEAGTEGAKEPIKEPVKAAAGGSEPA